MQASNINLRHLRAFCAVVAQGSVSMAARQVFLSQPAITQAIAKLEQVYDLRLFERSRAGMHPNDAALRLAERAQRAFAMLGAGIQEAQRAGGERAPRTSRDLPLSLTATQLRAFVAVGTAENFSLAARESGASQSALHRSTRELEELLGIDLFERTTRGIALTRAGQALFQQAKLAFAELVQARMELDDSKGVQSGTITIGSMPLSRHFIIPGAIIAFAAEYPAVNVKVIEAPYNELLHGLRYGEVDAVIGALRNPVPVEDVAQEKLFRASLKVIARRDHPLAKRQKLSMRDLGGYAWVVPPMGTPTRERFDAMFKRAGLPLPEGLVESLSVQLIRAMLTDSDRLTLISSHQLHAEIETGLFRALPCDLGNTQRDIGLTLRRGWKPTATQRALLAALRAAAKHYSEI
ncbi:MAG TPA: LysR family transcriptional regulator [Burkholderiales bacterium]